MLSRSLFSTSILALLLLAPSTGRSDEPLLRNGAMAEGTEVPAGWALSDYREGKLALHRDAGQFYSAPASLLVETDGQAAGMAFQALAQVPRGPITIEGYARREGAFSLTQVVLQVFEAGWKQIDWKIVGLVGDGAEWQPFKAEVTLPEQAAHVLAGLSLKGNGKAWLDDVRAEPAAGAAPVAPPADAEPLPAAVPARDPNLRYVGRFDSREAAGPRCAWPASTVSLRFRGTALNARLEDNGNDRFQVFVDGEMKEALALRSGTHLYRVAAGLPEGEHTLSLVKRTEAFVGTTRVLGFQLSEGGRLLPAAPATRRIEVVGDSISAGYGNEAPNQNVHFSNATENAALTCGALAARDLGAEYTCIAWSGRKMWPDNTIPELYDLALPLDRGSRWDFSSWVPDVVLVNLATNDFGPGNPDEDGWTKAYGEFLVRVRKKAPKAAIYCAIGPMMSDAWSKSKNALSTLRRYLKRIQEERRAAGDANIRIIEFPMQDMANGLGADWHPSLKTHRLMADQLVKTLQADLGWEKPAAAGKQ